MAVYKQAAPGGVTLSGYCIPAGTELMVLHKNSLILP